MRPVHLYLHIPYCVAKCPYCDFNSHAGHEDEHAAYVAALLEEAGRLPRGPYRTLFIGGGTPTILAPALLAVLLEGLRAHLRLADGYEWTCEANPGSADAERFHLLAQAGVNRLSVGVQSTDPERLRLLGRVHSPLESERALALARAAVPRVSADLIFGLPGQDAASLAADLALYRRHGLAHASVYHLTYEPGTEFHARRARGELADIDPDHSRALYQGVWDGLEALGLACYETSNFARPGEESRHNLAYWRGAEYQAAGAGAVATVGHERTTRIAHPGKYIAAIRAGRDAIAQRERIGARERLIERWMLGLRLREGVRAAELALLGDAPGRWQPIARRLAAAGLVRTDEDTVALTRAGRLVQDAVTVQLMPG